MANKQKILSLIKSADEIRTSRFVSHTHTHTLALDDFLSLYNLHWKMMWWISMIRMGRTQVQKLNVFLVSC